jgi:DNA-binding NtrC family response regulator
MLDDDIVLAAQSELTVLITATEADDRIRWARFIHDNSCRRGGPFVLIGGGGAITPTTILRGFRDASGGTLFVDGIANLDADALRMLVNGLTTQTVRVVSGSEPSLWTDFARRPDAHLLYRLNVIHLVINNAIGGQFPAAWEKFRDDCE